MITHLDHVGIVAHSLEESLAVLVDQLGLERDTERTPYPKGGYFAPERTKIFFVKVNLGETRIEILLPEDNRERYRPVPRAPGGRTASSRLRLHRCGWRHQTVHGTRTELHRLWRPD